VSRLAALQAYEVTDLGPEDMDVAEVHDPSAMGEVIPAENLGRPRVQRPSGRRNRHRPTRPRGCRTPDLATSGAPGRRNHGARTGQRHAHTVDHLLKDHRVAECLDSSSGDRLTYRRHQAGGGGALNVRDFLDVRVICESCSSPDAPKRWPTRPAG
jgi:hypothetical protein